MTRTDRRAAEQLYREIEAVHADYWAKLNDLFMLLEIDDAPGEDNSELRQVILEHLATGICAIEAIEDVTAPEADDEETS